MVKREAEEEREEKEEDDEGREKRWIDGGVRRLLIGIAVLDEKNREDDDKAAILVPSLLCSALSCCRLCV